MVAVASSAAKEDLISLLKVEPEKIHVIPIAAVNSARDLDGVGQLPAIPWAAGEFAFFPAQTFPHKNHEALLVALALLRDRSGLRIPIVCSGALSPHYRKVQRMVTRLRLADQVAFLGQISPAGVSALYGSCRLVIFPTLFEGWGLPATEAQASGAPLVCSRIRPLTDIAGAAAQYFNPEDPADIARGLSEVWLDDNLRKRLAAAGLLRAGSFTWDRTARIFRAWYRRLADRPTDVDRSLIEMEPAV